MKNKINQLLDSFLVSMSQTKVPSNRKKEFRISSFPYCPIRRLIFNELANESFKMSFYTSIGTAVHETIQKWITLNPDIRDKVYACWKIVELNEVIGPCLYKDIPRKYHNYTIEYEEITITYRGLSGHVDLVIEILPGKYLIVDFKTSNLTKNKIRYPMWQNMYPASRSSIIQISSYSSLLTQEFGLDVIGWCLVYVDRGDVISQATSYHKVLKPWNKKKTKRFMKFIDKACDNNKLVLKLNKILDKSKGYSEEGNKLLKSIVKNRPCVDDKTYDEWMDYAFYKGVQTADSKKEDLKRGVVNGECVLKKYCLKSDKSCLKAVSDKL